MATTSLVRRGVIFLGLSVALPVAALAVIDPAEPIVRVALDGGGCRSGEAASTLALTSTPERAQHSAAAPACGRWKGGAPADTGAAIEVSP